MVFNSFIGVITQWAGSRGFYIDSFQMAVEGDVSCSQTKYNGLVFSLELVDGVFAIWFCHVGIYMSTFCL